MPFRSKAQQRFLYAKHPAIAKEFAAKTKNFKALPEKVGKKTKATKKVVKDKKDMKVIKKGKRIYG